HDELGQVLTALKMDLSCLEEEVSHNPQVFGEKIQSMENLLDQTVETVQRICLELRPKILDVFGLSEAIEWQTKEFQRTTGISCELVIEQKELSLDSERSITCFRVLQEALTNVARHAKATHVHVRVAKNKDSVRLEVIDNGEGIEEHKVFHSHSLGLIGIRERAHHVKGEVSITGSRGQGTHVSVNIPYQ
ncbi:MAG: sensor histidine kinase, partial [Nitrospirales bacterium]